MNETLQKIMEFARDEFFDYYMESAADVLESGNQLYINQLLWYLEDPTVVTDSSHQISYIPYNIELKEIPDESEPTLNSEYQKELDELKVKRYRY